MDLTQAVSLSELEELKANRDYWHQQCIQAWQYRDGANAQVQEFESELIKLRKIAQKAKQVIDLHIKGVYVSLAVETTVSNELRALLE